MRAVLVLLAAVLLAVCGDPVEPPRCTTQPVVFTSGDGTVLRVDSLIICIRRRG